MSRKFTIYFGNPGLHKSFDNYTSFDNYKLYVETLSYRNGYLETTEWPEYYNQFEYDIPYIHVSSTNTEENVVAHVVAIKMFIDSGFKITSADSTTTRLTTTDNIVVFPRKAF